MQKLRNRAGLKTTKNSENVAVAAGVLNQNRNVIIEPLAECSAGISLLTDQPELLLADLPRNRDDHHSGRSCILPAVYEKGNEKKQKYLMPYFHRIIS